VPAMDQIYQLRRVNFRSHASCFNFYRGRQTFTVADQSKSWREQSQHPRRRVTMSSYTQTKSVSYTNRRRSMECRTHVHIDQTPAGRHRPSYCSHFACRCIHCSSSVDGYVCTPGRAAARACTELNTSLAAPPSARVCVGSRRPLLLF
jgi:hypothetical protein